MKIIVTGGGTGGHIYPAVSIAKAYQDKHKKTEILYIGKRGGLESEVVPGLGMPFKPIRASYLRKKDIRSMFAYFRDIVVGMYQSWKIIREFKPDIIVGTGGYVSAPVVLTGALMGKKTAIHESNAFPGKTNRMLAKKVDIAFVSFEEAKKVFKDAKRVIVSGTPVRDEFFNIDKERVREELEIPKDAFCILSVGGSGGARKMNESIFELMKKINGDERIYFIHVTGKSYYEKYYKMVSSQDVKLHGNIKILPYIYNMEKYMGSADLMITRAGALTLAEIAASKTPSVIIPSPNVKDNHQEFNAKSMEAAGAGIMLLENEMDPFELYNICLDLFENTEKLQQMKDNCSKISSRDGMNIIVKALHDL